MHRWKLVVGLSVLCCCTVALAVDTGTGKKVKGPKIDSSALTAVARVYTEPTAATGPDDAAQTPTPLKGTEGTIEQVDVSQLAVQGGTILTNTCATAITIASTSVTTVTLAGTTQSPTTFPCKSGGAGAGYAPMWYTFTATNGFLMADTCGTTTSSSPDTLLGLWRGTCTALVNVACGDDNCGEIGYQSQLQASGLTTGQPYWIQVAKWASADPDGDYTLNVLNCAGPPTITCQTGDYMEWEMDGGGQDPGYFPWYWGAYATNNGCAEDNVKIRGYARVVTGQTVCGSCMMYTSPEGVMYRDLDFYAVYVPTVPATITWDVTAAFSPVAWIIQPDPGVDPCANYTTLDFQSAASGICDPQVHCTAAVTTAGLYWVVVAPDFNQNAFSTATLYRATVNIDPPDEPTGACCTKDAAPTCSIQSKDACDAANGHYWGDGIACETVTCWACPAGATVATEGTCTSAPPYTWTGEQNNGCGATTPVFTDLGTTLPVTICGTACTYLDANPPTANNRDNDWYRYGTNAIWPINVIKGISATIQAEFPCEVNIAIPGPDLSECTTGSWSINKTAYAAAGEQVTVANCVKASTSTAVQFGRVWIIVRPSIRGNPLDIPCGVRYWLTVSVDDCPATGACCKTTGTNMGGCVITTATDCFATTGAVFYGQNTTCSDASVCCPCATTNTNEGETACAFPDSVDSSCFYLSGGTPPSTRKAKPITAGPTGGTTYCGSSAWVSVSSGGYIPDMDCYYFSVTATSDIFMKVYSSFEFHGYLLKEATGHGTWVCYTNPNNPNDPTAMKIWSWGVDNPSCVNWTGTAAGFSPGTYHACLRMSRDDPSGAICNSGAKPRYQVAVDVKIPGSCCVTGGCILSYQSDCTSAGGTWNGNYTDCDNPNPCCSVPCTDTENEANCGLPDDTVNGGCNITPHLFGAQLANCPSTVCGTAALDTTSGKRDTDWYLYHHLGGDMIFTVQAEFVPLVLVLLPNCDTISGWQAIATANDCQAVEMAFTGTDALDAGDYYLFVAPDFDANPGTVTCGMRYTATLSGCAPPLDGACCFTNGSCEVLTEADCTTAGGAHWKGAGTTCTPNPCGCRGDSNCDGRVNFSDIDLFVAAIPNNPTGWANLFQTRYGHAPTCPFLNNDCTGDGLVNFSDIDPFVALIPSVCP